MSNISADTRRLREIKTKAFPWYVIESLLFENGYQAVVLHRIAHWFKAHRIPLLGPLVARLSLWLTGVDIGPAAEIGPGLRIAHGQGIVVGGYAVIGSGATLLQQVTIGGPTIEKVHDMPRLGNDIFVGAGARIIGAVTIGDRSFIGVNAIIAHDVPADSRVIVRQDLEIQPQRESPIRQPTSTRRV